MAAKNCTAAEAIAALDEAVAKISKVMPVDAGAPMPKAPESDPRLRIYTEAQRRTGYGGISLVRKGDFAVVSVERPGFPGEMVEIIREHVDGMFSHHVSSIGVEECLTTTAANVVTKPDLCPMCNSGTADVRYYVMHGGERRNCTDPWHGIAVKQVQR